MYCRQKACHPDLRFLLHPPPALSPCVVSSSLPDWHMQMDIMPDSTSDLYNLQVSPMPSTSEGLYSWVSRGSGCLETCMPWSSWSWNWALLNPAPRAREKPLGPKKAVQSFGVFRARREGVRPDLGQRWRALLASLPSVV